MVHARRSKLLDFPMGHITEWYAQEENLPLEVATEHARELKRFLCLKALNPHKNYAMAGPVDELWHYFITVTEDYAAFCDIAGRFIHHRPEALQESASSDGAYERFLADYADEFGEAPPPELWPQQRFLIAAGAGASCGVCT